MTCKHGLKWRVIRLERPIKLLDGLSGAILAQTVTCTQSSTYKKHYGEPYIQEKQCLFHYMHRPCHKTLVIQLKYEP